MIKYCFSLLAMLLAVLSADAEVVKSTAGNLSGLIANPQSVTELTVTGTLNAADFDYIDNNMPSLRSLDLSGAVIEAYSGLRLRGKAYHAAGVIPARIFVGSPITSITLPTAAGLSIGESAFAGSAITSVSLGENVTSMGVGAFSSCQSLTDVIVSTPALGEAAFSDCPALRNVTFTVTTEVPAYTFNNCTALHTINGADKITFIDTRAFACCTSLQSLELGAALTEIGDRAFTGAGLVDVDLSGCTSLGYVGDWAFAQMPALRSLNLGSADSIGTGIVFECPVLEHFSFPHNATGVPDYAYTKNTSMDTTALMNAEVTYIGRNALDGLTQVTSITLPSSLEYIDDNAMANMTSLESITLSRSDVPSTGADVWRGVDQSRVSLLVPESSVESYKNADQWQNFSLYGISGVDDITAEVADASLRARLDGDAVVVEYSGLELSAVIVYDLEGRRLAAADAADGRAAVDVSAYATVSVFVVTATTPEGGVTSVKLAR